MDIYDVISLLGGLALFLYGMSSLGSGLERVSGGRLESILEKMTDNVFKGVLLGALVTAAVQSSGATTVITVGLVNAGILKLRQAIGVIMGANIGTTITAHILRMSDISSDSLLINLFKPANLAPIVALIGIMLIMGSKKAVKKDVGQILMAFSILFTGMLTMEKAVIGLKDVPQFATAFAKLSNPVLGVLVGAGITIIMQSSSVSVGILQALSSTGLISYGAALPVIMGQNIGAAFPTVMASIGATRSAKRTALVHVLFNVIGTLVFLIGTYALLFIVGFPFWNDPIDKGGIANFHTLFNAVVTIMFLPFSGAMEKLVTFLVKPTEQELRRQQQSTLILDKRLMVSPGLAVEQAENAVKQMADLAKENYGLCTGLFLHFDSKIVEQIKENENVIDRLEDRLRVYLLTLSEHELTEADSKAISRLLHMMTEFERIGDYSVNIYECAQKLAEQNLSLSEGAREEYKIITQAVGEIVELACTTYAKNDTSVAESIEPLEEIIDLMEEFLKSRHIDRLKTGACSIDVALPFIDMLSHLERISDHCSNIGVYVIGYSREDISDFDRHEYIHTIHQGNTAFYKQRYQHFEEKYLNALENAL